MRTMRSFQFTPILVTLGSLAIIGYFGYHAIAGVKSLIRLEAVREQRVATLTAQKRVRKAHEHKVGLLRPDSIDPDMLDERARASLNAAHKRDIIIFRKTRRPSN